MEIRSVRWHGRSCLCAFLLAGWIASAQPRKTIFLITDAEGVAGVCRQDQTDPKDQEMRQLLTGEINAAVDGLYDGGADDVIVWDGHDGSQTLSALTIHPRAKLIIGDLGVAMTLERNYAAIAFIGQHARANRKGGIMAHSYSSLGIQTMLMNGKPVGEIETRAALAGAFNTPVIFLSGDQAAADDLHAIVPNAELAVVKEGFSNYSCLTLSAEAARNLIHDHATRALKSIAGIKPYKLEGPVTIQIEYTTRNALGMDARLRPGAEIVDARTIRYHGRDFMEAWTHSQRP
jgi:D-amino peptidase